MTLVIRFFIFVILVLSLSLPIAKASDDSHLVEDIAVSELQYLVLNDATASSAEALLSLPKESWQPLALTNQHFSLSTGTTWLKVQLNNKSSVDQSSFLTLESRFELLSVNIYQKLQGQLVQLPIELTGVNLYFSNVALSKYSNKDIYVKLVTDAKTNNIIQVVGSERFAKEMTKQSYSFGAAIGGLLLAAAIMWLMYFTTAERKIGLLALYLTFRGFLLYALLGGSLFYWFGPSVELRGIELPLLLGFSSIAYLFFTSSLFRLKKHYSKAYRLILGLCIANIGALVIGAFASTVIMLMLSITMLMVVLGCLVGIGVYLKRQQQPLATFFIAVTSIQLILTIAVFLTGNLHLAWVGAREPLHIASFWINAILVILLMSRLYYLELKDKQKVQKEALEHALASQQAQEQLLQLQQESQDELEYRVQERTLELNVALTELEELNKELAEKSTIDELTNLYNRRHYDQKIMAEYRRSKRNLTPLSLILLDIDHFKSVNDTYGHLAGDQCLSWVAQIIKQSLKRSADIGFRYGGEEFAIILPDTEADGAIALAETVRSAIEKFDFIYKEQTIPLTISCGISTYKQQGYVKPEQLFFVADKALYQAKNQGRNQVQYMQLTKDELESGEHHE